MPPFGPRGRRELSIGNSSDSAKNSLARSPHQTKHRRLPGRDVKVEAARQQVAALASISSGPDLILQPPLATRQVREGKPHITLALVGSIVDRHQEPVARGALPREGHKTIAGPVAVSC